MNYLAHSHLSGTDQHILMGNFLGDIVKQRDKHLLPDAWQKGIVLHRHIDTFTDQHEVVREATKLLRPTHGKYAPIVVDVAFDYLLSRHWSLYGAQPLPTFIKGIYATLMAHIHLAPEYARSRVERMVVYNILHQSTHLAGIHNTFTYLHRRTKFSNQLLRATDSILVFEQELSALFLEFYPELIAMAAEVVGTG